MERPTDPAILDSARILVVDDQKSNRMLLAAQLRAFGFVHVDEAVDGEDALARIQAQRPTLIILDIVMPRMDGLAVCRWLRERSEYDDIPVIVQTALEKVADRVAAFETGANDVLAKPVNPAELRARIQIHLQNRYLLAELKAFRHRLTEELGAAQQLQHGLLPTQADVTALADQRRVRLDSSFQPTSEVAGDFWAALPLAKGRVGLLIADMSGHGVAAALNASRLHALVEPPPPFAESPAELFAFLNRRLKSLLPLGQFAAAFYGVIDPAARTLTHAGSAFCPPILIPERGAAPVLLDARNLPLGAMAGARYGETITPFDPATGLVFCYSDALVETEDGQGDLLTEDALAGLVAQAFADGLSGAEIVRRVDDHYNRRWGGHRIDDLTMVAITGT